MATDPSPGTDQAPEPRAALVTDFDGTMTRRDFYSLVAERLLPPGATDHWGDYRAGRTTHFEALQRIFAALGDREEAELLALVDEMGLDESLASGVERLAAHGIETVVVSAGCSWYIDRLLGGAGVDLEVYANPGRFVPGQGLLMQRPEGSRFVSHDLGVDKAAVVRDRLARREWVAFAGDGWPDLDAARLVPAERRFARADLAAAAAAEGLEFRPFERWSQIVDAVVGP